MWTFMNHPLQQNPPLQRNRNECMTLQKKISPKVTWALILNNVLGKLKYQNDEWLSWEKLQNIQSRINHLGK